MRLRIRVGPRDLSNRLRSEGALETGKAGLAARVLMEKQWTAVEGERDDKHTR
jgi:hypothetical protein